MKDIPVNETAMAAHTQSLSYHFYGLIKNDFLIITENTEKGYIP